MGQVIFSLEFFVLITKFNYEDICFSDHPTSDGLEGFLNYLHFFKKKESPYKIAKTYICV